MPAGVAVGLADLDMPRELAARTYISIRLWRQLPSGGHFLSREEPDLVAAALREFFHGLGG